MYDAASSLVLHSRLHHPGERTFPESTIVLSFGLGIRRWRGGGRLLRSDFSRTSARLRAEHQPFFNVAAIGALKRMALKARHSNGLIGNRFDQDHFRITHQAPHRAPLVVRHGTARLFGAQSKAPNMINGASGD